MVELLPRMPRLKVQFLARDRENLASHGSIGQNPSTWDVEAEGSVAQGHPRYVRKKG